MDVMGWSNSNKPLRFPPSGGVIRVCSPDIKQTALRGKGLAEFTLPVTAGSSEPLNVAGY